MPFGEGAGLETRTTAGPETGATLSHYGINADTGLEVELQGALQLT